MDINCTPDKRTIFLEHLSDLCDRIRTKLNELFESSSNVYVPSNKRTQEISESEDTPSPPTKQMRIERFVKKPVRLGNIHPYSHFLLLLVPIFRCTRFDNHESSFEILRSFQYGNSVLFLSFRISPLDSQSKIHSITIEFINTRTSSIHLFFAFNRWKYSISGENRR